MAYALRFGDYDFPATFYPAHEPSEASVPVTKLPRAQGGRASGRYLAEKVLRVEGGFLRETEASVRSQLDALKAGLQGRRTLSFESDRFWREVQLRECDVAYEGTGYGRVAKARLAFVTGDPFQYASVESSAPTHAIAGSPTTFSLATGGSAPALPRWSLTLGGSGATALDVTLKNLTTGESCTLNGDAMGGDVIVIDTLEQSVLVGAADRMRLFEGVFPSLAAGANSIELSFASGNPANLGAVWRDRWF